MTTYKHNNSFVNMAVEDVEKALSEAEARLRTGEVTYECSRFAAIKGGIDAGWPKELKEEMVKTGKAMSAGQPITLKIIMAAMNATLEKHVAPRQASKKGRNVTAADVRSVVADASLAWMLGVAPDVKGGPIDHDGFKIWARPFLRLGRMVVDVPEVDKADAFVYSVYNRELNRAVMIGWITRDELKKEPKGNRDTDEENCRWREMAHYVHFSKLRPMSDLLAKCEISDTFDGILLEKVPAECDVPIPSVTNFDTLAKKEDTGKDFWKEIGVDESTIGKE